MRLAIKPATIGTMIMLMIPNIILKKLISMNWPANLSIKKGVMTGETSVEQEVIVTDNATLPPARYVIKLDATPPGQEPIRTNPGGYLRFKSKYLGQSKAG